VLYIFDLLWLDGNDLRERPLIERKRLLRSIVPEQSGCLLYADHIEQHGVELFRLACDRDLEGVVAK
jgi:bifunctional non-homologous end joining protein LigD